MSSARGLFISFEGTEGSGKSTQMRLLVDRLRGAGLSVIENQEPGATRIGKQIRRILLDPSHVEITEMTELLLMFASRVQAAHEIILPALARGEIVVTDRFTDSTLAYQGGAEGIGFETVLQAHRLALGSLMPDLTICLMIDVEKGLARAENRNRSSSRDESEARLDCKPVDFHRRVCESYKKIAQLEPQRFRLIEGDGDPSVVSERVWAEVRRLIPLNGPVTQ